MADAGDDLLDGDGLLADAGDFDEDLDGDAEDALLADDTSYSDHYNLRTVPTSARGVYIESDHSSSRNAVSRRSSSADAIYQEVEDVAEGDEIIDDDEEDVLDLGVTDEFENELQDHPHNSSAGSVWIKQERIDEDNLPSLVLKNSLHGVHHVEGHGTGSAVKQEPYEVVDSRDVKAPNQQANVVVTSSTEVLEHKRYESHINESDEEENNNDEEQRDRFKTERTNVISLKNNSTNKWGEIPDSLDSVVTQQFNQHHQKGVLAASRGLGSRRGRSQSSQQHSSPHNIHINPHFKKNANQQLHTVHPSPWENQVPVPQQPPFEPPAAHQNAPPPPQHYGSVHLAPPTQLPPLHQPQQQPLPPGPPQVYHQQSLPSEPVHPPPSHLPQPQLSPAPWMRNEGPPQPQPQFDPHFNSGPPMQQMPQHHGPQQQLYYPQQQQRGSVLPPPPSNAMYPPQQTPYEQNVIQHHNVPHHPAPSHPHQPQPQYEYQQQMPSQRLIQPPPPGEEDSFAQCSPVRTVQFSRNSQQITIQMTANHETPPHYNPNQQFGSNVQPMLPQHQNNNWINRGMAPPPQHPQRPPHFIQLGPRMQQSPQQQAVPHMQVPRGQHPRFMRGGNFRRGVVNRHLHPRYPMPNKAGLSGDRLNAPLTGGPGGDGPFVGPPMGGISKRIGDVHQPPAIPYKQARFSNPNNLNVQQSLQLQLQHQRKGPVMSNLCEVPTVDNVPDTTTKIEPVVEDEDEETRQYRLKIAEQKQLREKLLQQKEIRRQMAAVKKQQEMQQKLTDQTSQSNNSNNVPITTNAIGQQILQQPSNTQRQSVHQRIGGKVLAPVPTANTLQGPPITGYKIVRVRAKDGSILIKKMPVKNDGQYVVQPRLRQQMQQQFTQQQQYQQNQGNTFIVPTINRRVVLDNLSAQKQQSVGKGPFYTGWKRAMRKNTPVTTIVPTKPAAAPAMTLGQRFSIQASQQQQQQPDGKVGIVNNQQQQQSLARSNRKVISSGGPAGHNGNIKVTALPPGPISHTVIVDNLTASTSKDQLIKMARQVGEIEKLNLEPKLKRATITFKNTSSAGAFYVKFQRKMVDLSMISVSIVPE